MLYDADWYPVIRDDVIACITKLSEQKFIGTAYNIWCTGAR